MERMLHLTLRWLALIALALLFILQQVYEPLVTIWVALGEFFHCASFVLLVDLLITNRGFKGLSVKTQICFLFVYWFRYFDSFFTEHPNHWIKVRAHQEELMSLSAAARNTMGVPFLHGHFPTHTQPHPQH